MPGGNVHLAVEMGSLPAWVLAGGALGAERATLLWFAGAYVGASLFLSPDLDLATSRAAQRWRGARALWRPYAALFRHRGISHSPLLGPLTRLVYLALLGGIGWGILHAVAGVPFPRSFPWGSLLPVLIGLYLPQLLHIALDRLATSAKHGR